MLCNLEYLLKLGKLRVSKTILPLSFDLFCPKLPLTLLNMKYHICCWIYFGATFAPNFPIYRFFCFNLGGYTLSKTKYNYLTIIYINRYMSVISGKTRGNYHKKITFFPDKSQLKTLCFFRLGMPPAVHQEKIFYKDISRE